VLNIRNLLLGVAQETLVVYSFYNELARWWTPVLAVLPPQKFPHRPHWSQPATFLCPPPRLLPQAQVIFPRVILPLPPRPIIKPKLPRLLSGPCARKPKLVIKPLGSTYTEVIRFKDTEGPNTAALTCRRVWFKVVVGDDALGEKEK